MNKNLQKIIDESENIVFFGGAGVSTESGIPDFRSESGLYNAMNKYGKPAEEIICRTFFQRRPEIFFEYYKENLIYQGAEPNEAHYGLARLEGQGKLKAIVTQNIDGLHQKAGSKNVLELHGSVIRNYCMSCHEFYDEKYIMNPENCKDDKGRMDQVPRCNKCGGMIKPDVVLYEEQLDQATMSRAIEAISKADVLIVGGTSLIVYPAAGMVEYFGGSKLVLINKSKTQYDSRADLVINEPIGQVFGEVF